MNSNVENTNAALAVTLFKLTADFHQSAMQMIDDDERNNFVLKQGMSDELAMSLSLISFARNATMTKIDMDMARLRSKTLCETVNKANCFDYISHLERCCMDAFTDSSIQLCKGFEINSVWVHLAFKCMRFITAKWRVDIETITDPFNQVDYATLSYIRETFVESPLRILRYRMLMAAEICLKNAPPAKPIVLLEELPKTKRQGAAKKRQSAKRNNKLNSDEEDQIDEVVFVSSLSAQ